MADHIFRAGYVWLLEEAAPSAPYSLKVAKPFLVNPANLKVFAFRSATGWTLVHDASVSGDSVSVPPVDATVRKLA